MKEQIPKHWKEIFLKEIVIYKKGKKPSQLKKQPFSNSLPYLDIKAIEKGIVSKYADKNSSIIVSENDLLVVWDGSRSGWLGKGREGALGSTLMAITPILVNQSYLYYYLNSKFEEINMNTTGIGIPHVDSNFFWNIKIPLPPLKEQDKIVKTLDLIFKKLNLFKSRLENIPKLLEKYRKLVLQKAITGDLTKEWRKTNKEKITPIVLDSKKHSIDRNFKTLSKLPNEWKWIALGNYARCSRGRFSARPRNDPQFYDGEYPFIQIGDLPKEGGFILSHKQTLNEKGLNVSKMFAKNTVAIAIVGATIGNTGILSYEMCFPDSLIGIDTNIDYSNFYIEYYLRQEKNNLREISYSSGGQPNIKIPIVNDYPLPLPPLEEQKEIVKKVTNLLKKADKLESYYDLAFQYFEHINKVVLQKAFTGKLVKIVDEDTSIKELLDKIKVGKDLLQSEIKENKKNRSKTVKMKPTNKSVYEVLETSKEEVMSAKDVWKKSKYSNDIEKFYEDLRNEIEIKKRVKEIKVETSEGSRLSLI